MAQQNPLWYGGDYNPEQWPESVWDHDIALMKEARVNLVTLGVFSWARIQAREGVFDFTWLDTIIGRLHQAGIKVDLATATAAHPAWASLAYPSMLVVDEFGHRASWGSRQSYCPNSEDYLRLSRALINALVARYKDHPAVVMWHINNELACHYTACYCDTCAAKFRTWLQERYGDLQSLNASWGTQFWSQLYYSWEEICPPRASTSFKNPGQVLDYQRFMSDSIRNILRSEAQVIRQGGSTKPITTNLMAIKHMDYYSWTKDLDVVSYDSYPDPEDPASPVGAGLMYSIMRSIGGGEPWYLMEQSPNQVNWRNHNSPKAPGQMRLWSYQALAHGSDSVLFFQWRASRRGAEKFHAGMVPVAGVNTRTFKDVVGLGRELASLGGLVGSHYQAKAGLLFDYQNWWAVEQHPRPSNRLQYIEQVGIWYQEFQASQIPLDIIPYTQGKLESYQLIVLPHGYLLPQELAQKLSAWVAQGGILLSTFFTAWADQEDAFYEGFAPGPLGDVLGLHVKEYEPLPRGKTIGLGGEGLARLSQAVHEDTVVSEAHVNHGTGGPEPEKPTPGDIPDHELATPAAQATAGLGASMIGGILADCSTQEPRAALWAEVLELHGAQSFATYAQGGQVVEAGDPAITVNHHGSGQAWYLSCLPDNTSRRSLFRHVAKEANLAPLVRTNSDQVEVSLRSHQGGQYLFILNHGPRTACTIPPGDWTGILEGPHYAKAQGGQTITMDQGEVIILASKEPYHA